MNLTGPTSTITASPTQAPDDRIRQLTRRQVAGVWAAAALPMATLSWVVAPLAASTLDGPAPLPRALIVSLMVGMVWQFLLVLHLVRPEQGSLRWAVLQRALWLHAPSSPRTGRRGGRLWLVLVPALVILTAEELVPSWAPPVDRFMPTFLGSDAGASLLSGSWGWYAVLVTLSLFNTVLGEELLFRGLLLPRMRDAFGRGDWLANGLLFAAYHLHAPWVIPTALLDTFALAYPSRRYRSALIGIAVHSVQSLVLLALALSLVLA
jgi:uncharacterized protein